MHQKIIFIHLNPILSVVSRVFILQSFSAKIFENILNALRHPKSNI